MNKKNDNKDTDEILRNRKKSESFDIRCLAFVLVDLIPYEKGEHSNTCFYCPNRLSMDKLDSCGSFHSLVVHFWRWTLELGSFL